MARVARLVEPGRPYHVTHRGNRGGDVFFSDLDRRDYLAGLRKYGEQYGLDVWGYCLMSNHVHLLVVPQAKDSMSLAIGREHMRHARHVNAGHGWTGHLWANRFYSTMLDDEHLWVAIKYVELNPVRAGMVAQAGEWPWSSARAHIEGARDGLLAPDRPFGGPRPHPLDGHPIGWAEWLALGLDEESLARLRQATATGRPCGTKEFVKSLEKTHNRALTPKKRGRKSKYDANK